MATWLQDDDPALPTALRLVVPIEGTQVRITWTHNAAAHQIMLRRDVRGAPVDETAGELVALLNPAGTTTQYLDYANLVPEGREYQWWYYRIFFKRAAPLDAEWLTADILSDSILVFKSGKHFDVMLNKHYVPEFMLATDTENKRSLVETITTDQVINIGETGANTYGPFNRLLRMLCFELDRVHAHLKSLADLPSIMDASAAAVAQIGQSLGYAVDGNNLHEARVVLESLMGIYKRTGTSSLVELVSNAELSTHVRVQEMAGFVMRAANPDLWRD